MLVELVGSLCFFGGVLFGFLLLRCWHSVQNPGWGDSLSEFPEGLSGLLVLFLTFQCDFVATWLGAAGAGIKKEG